jgi:histone-lysine N-methyltransferase SETMAR
MILSRIVTGDETWCHHFKPESKRQSEQWKHVNSPPPKKSKAVHNFLKVMMMFFFDGKGPLLVEFLEFLEHGFTISALRYEDTLQKLRHAIKSKYPGMLLNGIILLHDNVCPHTANSVRNTLQRFGWEVLQHLPYSPDLFPCDFHIFGDLKKDIRGHGFA